MSVPLWVRAVLAVERAFSIAASRAALLRDEILFAWLTPPQRQSLTTFMYARQQTYAPGGRLFEGGLFDWEKRAIADAPFPSKGRILVGGAGGGREVVALRDRGYEVFGFEPCEPLVIRGQPAVKRQAGASLVCASYADLVRAAKGDGGPLSQIVGTPFDGVILGWASLSHLMGDGEPGELLAAIAQIAPTAPVLLSFLSVDRIPGIASGTERHKLRRIFKALGAPSVRGTGDGILPWGGFVHGLTPDDLTSLASGAGYAVAYEKKDPYPHAVLVPAR